MWQERGLITQNERDGQFSGVGEREKRKGRGENETKGRERQSIVGCGGPDLKGERARG